jgi:hypothetical protein
MKFDLDSINILTTFLISLISGFISILQQINKGHAWSLVWFTAELSTAAFCGCIAYKIHPVIINSIPAWLTMPLFIVLCSHFGSRILQTMHQAYDVKSQDLINTIKSKSPN